MLLDRGANIEALEECGCSPLYKAAENGRLEAVTVLLARGANFDSATCVTGLTPLTVAVQQGHTDVVTALENAKYDASMKELLNEENVFHDEIPSFCLCPITLLMMQDPVVCSDGITYERFAIERWLLNSSRSPKTNVELPTVELISNIAVRDAIAYFRQNRKRKLEDDP